MNRPSSGNELALTPNQATLTKENKATGCKEDYGDNPSQRLTAQFSAETKTDPSPRDVNGKHTDDTAYEVDGEVYVTQDPRKSRQGPDQALWSRVLRDDGGQNDAAFQQLRVAGSAHHEELDHQIEAQCWAASTDNVMVLEYLLNTTKDAINMLGKDHRCSLHIAASRGNDEVVRLLLAFGASTETRSNQSHFTPLMSAAHCGHERIIEILIGHEAIQHTESRYTGQTALHQAASNGHYNAVQTLLNWKCRVDKKSVEQETPLHLACKWGHHNVVVLLLDRGASAKVKNKSGETALHHAASNGCDKVVQVLLIRGVNINAANVMGKTALHAAATSHHDKVVELLLAKRPNTRVKDYHHRTTVDYAIMYRNNSIIQQIKIYNAANPEPGWIRVQRLWTLLEVLYPPSTIFDGYLPKPITIYGRYEKTTKGQ